MRFRRLTADETVQLFRAAKIDAVGLTLEATRVHVREVLAAHGTDVVNVIRARRWIRRGRRRSEKWIS